MTFAFANYANFGQAQERAPIVPGAGRQADLTFSTAAKGGANVLKSVRLTHAAAPATPREEEAAWMNSSADKKTSMLQLEQASSVTRPRRLLSNDVEKLGRNCVNDRPIFPSNRHIYAREILMGKRKKVEALNSAVALPRCRRGNAKEKRA